MVIVFRSFVSTGCDQHLFLIKEKTVWDIPEHYKNVIILALIYHMLATTMISSVLKVYSNGFKKRL